MTTRDDTSRKNNERARKSLRFQRDPLGNKPTLVLNRATRRLLARGHWGQA